MADELLDRLRAMDERFGADAKPVRGHEGYAVQTVRGNLCDGMVGNDAVELCAYLRALPNLIVLIEAMDRLDDTHDEHGRCVRASETADYLDAYDAARAAYAAQIGEGR